MVSQRSTFGVKRITPNLFYRNIEIDNPEELASWVHFELEYINGYLRKSLDKLSNDRFGITWKIDDTCRYELYPRQSVFIDKPVKQIIVEIPPDVFDPNVPLLDGNYHPIEVGLNPQLINGRGVLYTLRNAPNKNLALHYKDRNPSWSSFSLDVHPGTTFTSPRKKEYKVSQVSDSGSEYEVHLDKYLNTSEILQYNGIKINYKVDIKKFNSLKDGNKKIEYIVVSEDPIIIETMHQVKEFRVDNGEKIDFLKLKKDEGIWVRLSEPESQEDEGDSYQASKLDMFYVLLNAGQEYEVWETPSYKGGRIKVLNTLRDENKLQLERTPVTDLIYPPSADYQLKVQQQAVRTLMYFPAEAHRNLLRLFEPYDTATWTPPCVDFDSEHIEWAYLKDLSREGTDEQRRFVLKAMNTCDYAILEGPPGSGKTMTITELIYQLLKNGNRVLLSASTHVAVDNVLEMLKEKIDDPSNNVRITPLRIGREDVVSPVIQKFQIDSRKNNIQEKLVKVTWFEALSKEEKEDTIDNLTISSSNLVCGTTLGILQYPNFKKSRWGYVHPEFDYLIIDEASKTTFHEFLVPAVHAKKWVLVGDIRQLAPYTDTLQVQVNLDGLINETIGKAYILYLNTIYDRISVNQGRKYPKIVIVHDTPIINALIKLIVEKNNSQKHSVKYCIVSTEIIEGHTDNILFINPEDYNEEKIKLYTMDIIILDILTYNKIQNNLPETHTIINFMDENTIEPHDFRNKYWLERNRTHFRGDTIEIIEHRKKIVSNSTKSWAGEVAWRMKRVNEIHLGKDKENTEKIDYYWRSLHELLPPHSRETGVQDYIRRIERICYPSVISSLQEGVSKRWGSEEKTVFSTGFPGKLFEKRHEKLTYQHRMHKEISWLPRKIFYEEKALKDISLISKKGHRDWDYGHYTSRLVWLNVKSNQFSKNYNPDEVNVIFQELNSFQKWASTQEKDWSVLAITFYEKQRRALRDMLRRFPGNERRETRFQLGKVSVGCYTVDRVQGREADIVFLSMVRNSGVGFMDNPNRLNVSLTRAKYQQVIVGDYDHFNSNWVPEILKEVATSIENVVNC